MSSKLQLWSVLILLLGGLTSCASGNIASQSPIHSDQPESTAITSPEPVTTPTTIPTPTATVTPEVIQKTYQMNKNYFIVPKVDSDNKKVVLLTFDDGPKEKPMIDEIINILDKHNAKAIFFVNGYRIKQNPDLLKLIFDRGQIIGNHSWDHINLKKENNETITKQIMDVQDIVKELTGITPEFFRPPFGTANDYIKELVKNEHMLYMTWSNGSLDWESSYKNKPLEIIKSVMEQLESGKNNILMHELPWTVIALDSLLQQIEEKGYFFVDPRAIDLEVKPD